MAKNWSGHTVIAGATGTGKSHLAKAIAAQEPALVYDLTATARSAKEWGKNAVVITTEEEFIEIVNKTDRKLIIIDEAAEALDARSPLVALFTRGRHNGLRVIACTQRYNHVPTMVRDNAARCVAFKMPITSSTQVAYDYNMEAVKNTEIARLIAAQPVGYCRVFTTTETAHKSFDKTETDKVVKLIRGK